LRRHRARPRRWANHGCADRPDPDDGHRSAVIGSDPAPSFELLVSALEALPNDDVPDNDRKYWVNVAQATRGASVGTLFEHEAREVFSAGLRSGRTASLKMTAVFGALCAHAR
jgi:hypothetical protein